MKTMVEMIHCELGAVDLLKPVFRILDVYPGIPALWNRFYGSGSGSDFWKVMVPIPVPTFEKLWFRFRFLLLKSYGSGSGSTTLRDPDYFPSSRIQQQQKRGGGNYFSYLLLAINFTNLRLILSNWPKIYNATNCYQALRNTYGLEILDPEKTYLEPGSWSRSQKSIGSRIQNRNTAKKTGYLVKSHERFNEINTGLFI